VISVAEALERALALAVPPVATEAVALAEAGGRVLRADVAATRDQPPFDASAMDGYAVPAGEVRPGAVFRVVATARAGQAAGGRLGPGEAARIFTGAPVPAGAGRVVMQEDVRHEGDAITLLDSLGDKEHIRPRGDDFTAGERLVAPRRLSPADLALIAAMNIPEVTVARRPDVAILATGDELVMPGEAPGPDQIIAGNGFALKALIEEAGGEARLLPIARDDDASLRTVFALAEGADLIVTIGGASVGEHDLVARVGADLGLDLAFHKVAIRPGKPVMAGRLGAAAMLGLPGNPVSALVTAHVFLRPMIAAMLGLPAEAVPARTGRLAVDLPGNGPRSHYMRARLSRDGLVPFENQDSAHLKEFAAADALVVRPPGDPPRAAGAEIVWIALRES